MTIWNLFKTAVWWVFGGLPTAFEYAVSGVLWCITIIGIPFGIQSFKLALVSLFPFDYSVSEPSRNPIGCFGNVIWIVFFGLWIALTHLFFGLLLCITIIGIPWGKMHFRLAAVSFAPFGRDVELLPNAND